MFSTTTDALGYIRAVSTRQQQYDPEQYRVACELLVDQRDQLTERVYIDLPGGLGGNNDPAWHKVRNGSRERCSCGNERVIVPSNPRTTFVASESGTVTVSPESEVYLKPLGGDKSSAYIRLLIKGDGLAFITEPFAPFILTLDFFSTKGYRLDMLADVLPKEPTPPVFMFEKNVPVFAINAVDLASKTVTITPDQAVEIFDPKGEPDHSCS